MIKNKLKDRINKMNAISERILFIILKLNKFVALRIVQEKASISSHEDEEVTQFYEEISRALETDKTRHSLVRTLIAEN